jgi:hypothetical protein
VTKSVSLAVFEECSEKDPLLNRPIKIPVILLSKIENLSNLLKKRNDPFLYLLYY